MPWVLFIQKFNWRVKPTVNIAYKAGNRYLVKRACADEAIGAGKGIEVGRPPKREAQDASG